MIENIIPFLAPLLLVAVLAGYFWTVFEPYFAHNTAEGIELMNYHAQDRKLQIIAEYWTAKLGITPTAFYDSDDLNAQILRDTIIYELTRYRLVNGDDPSKLVCGAKTSPLLQRAFARMKRPVPHVGTEHIMLISPKEVSMADGRTLWRGRPMEYKSRFCDFYPEP